MGRIGIRLFAGSLFAASLSLAALTAQATTYYNLTNIDPTTNTAICATFPCASDTVAIDSNLGAGKIGTALFTSNTNGQVVGTGVLDPFVRIQQNGNGNCKDPCVESGFNTDGTARFETKDHGGTNWDHSLLLSNVGTETINGVLYRDFILDINEANNSADRYLSLDKFIIYQGSVGNLDQYTESTPDCGNDATNTSCVTPDSLTGGTMIYNMDKGTKGDSTLGLNYNLNSGSGKGVDMIARVPDALFDKSKPFVYLYSSFGATGDVCSGNGCKDPSKSNLNPAPGPSGILPDGNYGQSAGFEEWASRRGKVPEPLTAGLFAIGLAALGLSRRQRKVSAH